MKNDHEICGDTLVIRIATRGLVVECLADAVDSELIAGYRWSALKNKSGGFYAYCNTKKMLMHRVITSAPAGSMVDHINHNTMDNRRANLRVVDNAQNMQNLTKATRRSRSGVLNVFWYKNYQKWEAGLRLNGKNIKLGYFDDIKAAEAAVKAARARLMPFSQEALAAGKAQ